MFMRTGSSHLSILLMAAIASTLPCGAQPTYTPYNSYSPDTSNTQLRGADNVSPYQNPSEPGEIKPFTDNVPNNYSNNPARQNQNPSKHKIKKAKTKQAKSNKSGISTVAGAPGKATKVGVGLTDRTAKTGVGLTDRAAKTGVGLPAKALKETFKAIF